MNTETFPINQKVKSLTGSRKRQFRVNPTKGENMHTASFWDGGSRHEYVVVNIKTGQRFTPPVGSYPMFSAHYTLQPNEVLVETGVICGKPATPYFHCLNEDLTAVKTWLEV